MIEIFKKITYLSDVGICLLVGLILISVVIAYEKINRNREGDEYDGLYS